MSHAHARNRHLSRQFRLRHAYEGLLRYGNTRGVDAASNYYKLRQKILLHGLPDQSMSELEETKIDAQCSLRGKVWKIFLNIKTIDHQQYLSLIERGASSRYAVIQQDIERTFKHDTVFENVVSKEKLSRCLNAFVHLCPEVGYVQGMNTLCGTFLFVMPEIDAFHCFVALIKEQCWQYLIEDLPGVHAALNLLGKILQYTDRELYNYLRFHQYTPPFLMHAILSLGAGTPPLSEVLKLWDFYMAFGIHMNVICTVAQIILMRDTLLAHDSPCTLLHRLPKLDAESIISLAVSICKTLPQFMYDLLVQHPNIPIKLD